MQKFILMLGDDTDDRYFTESTIEELGIDVPVKFALFSEDLLASIATEKPLLIILSYHNHHGIDILNRIRSVDSLSGVPVIALIEEITDAQVREFFKQGANSVIKKPSTVSGTRDKIRTFFNYWLHVAEL